MNLCSSIMGDVTQLLHQIARGDRYASEQLLPVVYDELRRLAAARLANEPSGQTLQPTALVHEAYLRLVGNDDPKWDGRGHFFSAAAEAMRRILVDAARRKQTTKRGGDRQRVTIDFAECAAVDDPRHDLVALDEALQRFQVEDPQAARLVELRHFAGMTNREAAEILGISVRTADRLWAFARAWLLTAIQEQIDP